MLFAFGKSREAATRNNSALERAPCFAPTFAPTAITAPSCSTTTKEFFNNDVTQHDFNSGALRDSRLNLY